MLRLSDVLSAAPGGRELGTMCASARQVAALCDLIGEPDVDQAEVLEELEEELLELGNGAPPDGAWILPED